MEGLLAADEDRPVIQREGEDFLQPKLPECRSLIQSWFFPCSERRCDWKTRLRVQGPRTSRVIA
jgi:hypothetical protein